MIEDFQNTHHADVALNIGMQLFNTNIKYLRVLSKGGGESKFYIKLTL
jgi:hypothetical protein